MHQNLRTFYLSDFQGEKSITEILPFFLQGIGVFGQFLAVIHILEFLQKSPQILYPSDLAGVF